MSLPYTQRVNRVEDEGGTYFFAKIEELPGCHTDGATAEEAIAELQQVMRDYLEVKLEMGASIPEPTGLPSGKFPLRLPKSLHAELQQMAAREDVSLNQLMVYILSKAAGSNEEAAALN
ncbi:toxin-antitoxin system HicB family antitoxin [Paenibacillus alvei]|uniref:Toxin-antitoxin system HicB family antitoxin n=2 Tax=Paenibacillus alvei TaxID=44250 RepID=A0AAP7DKX6_PAEAL|nr:toxin-antitoxin system HicB family antitoxin [Paenibacillus alvei]